MLEICLNLINKPLGISKFWLNWGLRYIPFKLGQKVKSEEFYHCTCQRRYFEVTFLKRKVKCGVSPRAQNYFYCWFAFLMEIKLKTLYKYRNNLICFTSLLLDFFSFINQSKYVYVQPNYTNDEYFNLKCESFHYYLNERDSCLCYGSVSGPF